MVVVCLAPAALVEPCGLRDALTLPGAEPGQIPQSPEPRTPQQQTCPSQRARGPHFQHPDRRRD